jgi:hypothetical protein
MKINYLLYEVKDLKKFTLKYIDTFPFKAYAKNKMLESTGKGKVFVIKKAFVP